jgi:hypothetical protein
MVRHRLEPAERRFGQEGLDGQRVDGLPGSPTSDAHYPFIRVDRTRTTAVRHVPIIDR